MARKKRALNPERADIRQLAMSSAYVWMLSLGAKVCLSPKIRRAVAGGKPGGVNALRFGPPLVSELVRGASANPMRAEFADRIEGG